MPYRRRTIGPAAGVPLRTLAEASSVGARALETIAFMRARLKQHCTHLEAWREPDGELVGTEPDPVERQIIRARLEAIVEELRAILQYAS